MQTELEVFKKTPLLIPRISSDTILTGDEFSGTELGELIELARVLKDGRRQGLGSSWLRGKTLVLMFEKPSFRTRLSFSIAMQELGGFVVESVSGQRKSEEPRDLARVLNGYCHGLMVRGYEEEDQQEMARYLKIPLINGLTNNYHPCQILADLLTIKERFGQLQGMTIAYIGDGNNILNSLALMAVKLGVNINYCCPVGNEPSEAMRSKFSPSTWHVQSSMNSKEFLGHSSASNNTTVGRVKQYVQPVDAVRGAHAIYTDVWTSMGFEGQKDDVANKFKGFQVNEDLFAAAKPEACLLHCMPMVRGEEISETLPDQPCSAIFDQAENRLHVQKALLATLMT